MRARVRACSCRAVRVRANVCVRLLAHACAHAGGAAAADPAVMVAFFRMHFYVLVCTTVFFARTQVERLRQILRDLIPEHLVARIVSAPGRQARGYLYSSTYCWRAYFLAPVGIALLAVRSAPPNGICTTVMVNMYSSRAA